MAGVEVEELFTAALGLQAPWVVKGVELDPVKRRIDFEVVSEATRLKCPGCGAEAQGIHDRVRRSWRHLDFFQFEAWLHAAVPRVKCVACGKTLTVWVPWAREGSGLTVLFEALGLTLCRDGLTVKHAARMLRVRDKGWGESGSDAAWVGAEVYRQSDDGMAADRIHRLAALGGLEGLLARRL